MSGYIEAKHYHATQKRVKIYLASALVLACVLGSMLVVLAQQSNRLQKLEKEVTRAQNSEKEFLDENIKLKGEVVAMLDSVVESREVLDDALNLVEEAIQTSEALVEEVNTLNQYTKAIDLEGFDIIVDVNDVSKLSRASEAQLNKLLEGTSLQGHGWDFLVVEREYQINSIVLMSIFKEESGLGASPLAQRANNLGGIVGGSGFRNFGSFKECIEYTAELLSKNYLDPEGKYYNGKSLRGINIKYCLTTEGTIDWGWNERVSVHASKFEGALESSGY